MSLQDDAAAIKATLSVIFNEQGDRELSRLLDDARAEVEYVDHDNWNGGIDIYVLLLWITPQRFAGIEDDVASLEKRIGAKLGRLNLDRGNEQLSGVRISVDRVSSSTAVRLPFASPTDEARIWRAGSLRLFVSHVSRIKISAAKLKAALELFGIDAFVAHDDIEPTREWALEIEFALRSMHALCALVTSDFHSSMWCDQEVGVALGRSVPVLPVRFGADPYGLMGKLQAIPRADSAEAMAERIFSVLMKTESCRSYVMEGLVSCIENAHTYATSKHVISRIVQFKKHLSADQVRRMLVAARDNSQVREAINVPTQIESIAKAAGMAIPKEEFVDEIRF
jgi:hypothetical protein